MNHLVPTVLDSTETCNSERCKRPIDLFCTSCLLFLCFQ